MRNSCRQLACDERCQIKAPMSRGISMREIARCRGWSPEQIEGRLKRLGEETVGREWICRQVKADRKAGGELYLCLRRRGKKPNWRGGRHAGRGHIPCRVDIVTADNGKEFAGHRQVEDRLNRRTPFEDFHEGLLSP